MISITFFWGSDDYAHERKHQTKSCPKIFFLKNSVDLFQVRCLANEKINTAITFYFHYRNYENINQKSKNQTKT